MLKTDLIIYLILEQNFFNIKHSSSQLPQWLNQSLVKGRTVELPNRKEKEKEIEVS